MNAKLKQFRSEYEKGNIDAQVISTSNGSTVYHAVRVALYGGYVDLAHSPVSTGIASAHSASDAYDQALMKALDSLYE